jgi:hypothetical protein
METSLHKDAEEGHANSSQQAWAFLLHTSLALASWVALMLVGYLVNPSSVSQGFILALSLAVPAGVGYVVSRFRNDEIAPAVWLVGLIWILIVSLWILDMPTGPNQCLHCGATEKLSRTLLSFPTPGGLIDDDGPFIGTWPAAALIGYAIGARLARRKSAPPKAPAQA